MSNHVRQRPKKNFIKTTQEKRNSNTNSTTAVTQNERLQRNFLNEKLSFIQQQKQQQKYQLLQQLQIKTQPDEDICRDVNCCFNSCFPNIGCATANPPSNLNECEFNASSSECLGSTSSSSSNLTTSTTICTRSDIAGINAKLQRDDSPDSGVHSDGNVGENAFGALEGNFTVDVQIDPLSWLLFCLAFCTRMYQLTNPRNIVFDELHYGKYISLYLRHIFFFDQHPPLGKQLIVGVANLAGFDGNFNYTRIGAAYEKDTPIFWLRFVPALCGSLLVPAVYKLLLEARLSRWASLLGGLMIIFDNAMLTQSRFILMESMLLLFCTLGLFYLLKFQRCHFGSSAWLLCGLAAAIFLTFAASVKHAGILTACLAAYLTCRFLWNLLYDARITAFRIMQETLSRVIIFVIIPIIIYLSIFYIHFYTLYRAGPHDSIMTSAFQASLEGGLASITRGQPVKVAHGSQITLRHTHGRTCWLHSHPQVYPIRYRDKRGSSHQQQVTCYSFKDVNNWWIVKRPNRNDLTIGEKIDAIRDGDVIQLVHGITSRALNSHDVAAPISPQCQEVSCYIDYEINMPGELLWRVEIVNKEKVGRVWHAIKSEVRLIHESSGAALRFTGRQLPEWGFHQHEVAADRVIEEAGTIWNVEEHRYTRTQNARELERQLLNAEMIPIKQTQLSFWEKFLELQIKLLSNLQQMDNHVYSSSPLEWPLLNKGIAYWMESETNRQIHLLGNVLLWYTATISLIIYALLLAFYLARRQRLCFDLSEREWQRFREAGDIFFIGYLMHYVPYFLVDHTLFLHHYFPALLFKFWLLCFIIEHLDYLIRCCSHKTNWFVLGYRSFVIVWLLTVIAIFVKFLPLSYGFQILSIDEIMNLRWKDSWDFLLRRNLKVESGGLEKPISE